MHLIRKSFCPERLNRVNELNMLYGPSPKATAIR